MNNIPREIIQKILLSNCLDILSVCNIKLINKENAKTVELFWHDIICNIFYSRFTDFCQCANLTLLLKSDLNLKYVYINLENIDKVAHMKKKAKYKHLLKNIHNGKMFYRNTSKSLSKHDREINTLRSLLDLFDFVKSYYDVHKQPYEKTNLSIWAMYPLFYYIWLSLKNDIENDSIFRDSDIRDIVINRIFCVKQELHCITNCSSDIKIKLVELLSLISSAYTF